MAALGGEAGGAPDAYRLGRRRWPRYSPRIASRDDASSHTGCLAMAVRKKSPSRLVPMTWPELKALALSLDLPNVTESISWGQPNLKAHGKLWCWWSPHCDAPVFKVSFEQRDALLEFHADVFFVHPHYRNHPLVLMRPERFDREWAMANLLESWRGMAPKRVLKAYDDAR